jgi:hypothetical protein
MLGKSIIFKVILQNHPPICCKMSDSNQSNVAPTNPREIRREPRIIIPNPLNVVPINPNRVIRPMLRVNHRFHNTRIRAPDEKKDNCIKFEDHNS